MNEEQVIDWIKSNWAIIALFLGYFVEISPIKIYPLNIIKKILKWSGEYITSGLSDRMDKIEKDVKSMGEENDRYRREQDEKRMLALRWQILDFADAINRRDYSHEAYEHILFEVHTEYEDLLKKYDLQNGKVDRAIQRIDVKYNASMQNNPNF